MENLEKKWLSDDLSEKEKQSFQKHEDFYFKELIIEGAKYFKVSNFYKIDDFNLIKTNFED